MLSPKATNLVALIRGTATVTVTAKLQEAVSSFESVTVHATVVGPAGKLEPLDGEQTIDTGGVPAATVGGGYDTETGELAAPNASGRGQVMIGGSVGTIGVGGDGEAHPAARRAPKSTTGTHRRTGRLGSNLGFDHIVSRSAIGCGRTRQGAVRYNIAVRLLSPLFVLAASIVLGSCGNSPTQPTTLTVSSIAPTSGTTLGGTPITITGSNFTADATVTVGGVSATGVTVSGSTTLTAVTAQRIAGAADVVVTSGGKTGRLPAGFSYVAPAATTNMPPVIGLLSARGTRPNQPVQFADLDEQIDVLAVVADTETPGADLTYEWTSNAGGTFTGSGPSVKWRAPLSPPLIPINASLTLMVIERYASVDASGLPVTLENRVSKTIEVSVHDSKNEISVLAREFLLDFSNSSLTDPATILRNFTDDLPACEGAKRAEANEIVSNRQNYVITSSSVGAADVTLNFQGICPIHTVYGDACAFVPVDWRSTRIATGQPEHVRGTDQVSAVYLPAQGRWRLCGSDFDGVTLPNGAHRFIR